MCGWGALSGSDPPARRCDGNSWYLRPRTACQPLVNEGGEANERHQLSSKRCSSGTSACLCARLIPGRSEYTLAMTLLAMKMRRLDQWNALERYMGASKSMSGTTCGGSMSTMSGTKVMRRPMSVGQGRGETTSE